MKKSKAASWAATVKAKAKAQRAAKRRWASYHAVAASLEPILKVLAWHYDRHCPYSFFAPAFNPLSFEQLGGIIGTIVRVGCTREHDSKGELNDRVVSTLIHAWHKLELDKENPAALFAEIVRLNDHKGTLEIVTKPIEPSYSTRIGIRALLTSWEYHCEYNAGLNSNYDSTDEIIKSLNLLAEDAPAKASNLRLIERKF